jgi:hypothetical protein
MVCSETDNFVPAVPRAHPAPELLGGSFINGLRRNTQLCSHGVSRAHSGKTIGRLFYEWSAAKRMILLSRASRASSARTVRRFFYEWSAAKRATLLPQRLARTQRKGCWEALL